MASFRDRLITYNGFDTLAEYAIVRFRCVVWCRDATYGHKLGFSTVGQNPFHLASNHARSKRRVARVSRARERAATRARRSRRARRCRHMWSFSFGFILKYLDNVAKCFCAASRLRMLIVRRASAARAILRDQKRESSRAAAV